MVTAGASVGERRDVMGTRCSVDGQEYPVLRDDYHRLTSEVDTSRIDTG